MDKLQRHIKLARLIVKQRFTNLSDEENHCLTEWKSEDENADLYANLSNKESDDVKDLYANIDVEKNWRKLIAKKNRQKSIKVLKSFGIAASVVVAFTLSVFVYHNVKRDVEIVSLNNHSGKQSVRLILGDGEKIELSGGDKDIKSSLGERTAFTSGNKLIYSGDKKISIKTKNTLLVPKGAFYHLILSDGTRVWLNSDSRLTYPVSFSGKTREVNLVGEAYFEVQKNKDKPFIVKTSSIDVKVLGTIFNLNTYADNGKVSTILVEGKVEVYNKKIRMDGEKDKVVLSPGQLAELNVGEDNAYLSVSDVDPMEYISWKDGVFCFRKTPIREIMKKIERYYGVEVLYTQKITNEFFTGDLSMDRPIEDLIEVFELSTKLKFEIKGKRVYIK